MRCRWGRGRKRISRRYRRRRPTPTTAQPGARRKAELRGRRQLHPPKIRVDRRCELDNSRSVAVAAVGAADRPRTRPARSLLLPWHPDRMDALSLLRDNKYVTLYVTANRYVYSLFKCIVGICIRPHSGVVVTAARLRVGLLPLGAAWDFRQTVVNALSYSTLDRTPKLRRAERRQRRSEPASANVHATPKPAVGRGPTVGRAGRR